MPLAGKPILAWSVASLARHPLVTDLLVVVPRGWGARAERTILAPLRRTRSRGTCCIHRPVIGGALRQDSARAGLEAAARLTEGSELGRAMVLIHDAARPIVALEMVDDLLAGACVARSAGRRARGAASARSDLRRAGRASPRPWGVVPVIPVGDTLKAVQVPAAPDQLARVRRTIPRDGLWRVQTPQVFPIGPVLAAHREAHATGREVTDDAMLFEWKKWPVVVAPGSTLARKVTYAVDLELLEGWLRGPGRAYRRALWRTR